MLNLDSDTVPRLGLIVGVVAAILAVIVPWLIHTREAETRQIEYDIDSSENLLPRDPDINGKIEVLCDGIPVKRLYAHSVRLISTGNKAIEPENYHGNIHIIDDIDEDSGIVGITVSEVWPEDMVIEPAYTSSVVTLPKVLLNSGDGYTITLLTTSTLVPQLKGRIVNGELKKFRSSKESYTPGQILQMTGLYALPALLLFGFPRFISPESPYTIFAILGIVFLLFIAMSVNRRFSHQRDLRRWGRMPRRAIREMMEMD